MTDKPLISWLLAELDARGWTQNELARRSGVSSGHLSHILSGTRDPGLDFYQGIAFALHLPLEEVLRNAGILPASADDPTTAGLLARLAALPAPARQPLLDLFHSILDLAPALASVTPVTLSPPHLVTPSSSSSPKDQVQTRPDSETNVIPFLRKPRPTLDDFSAWLDELPPEVVEELARSIMEREDEERAAPKPRRALKLKRSA